MHAEELKVALIVNLIFSSAPESETAAMENTCDLHDANSVIELQLRSLRVGVASAGPAIQTSSLAPRSWTRTLRNPKILLQVDVRKAFNSISAASSDGSLDLVCCHGNAGPYLGVALSIGQ